MAIVGFRTVRKNLKSVIDYAENPDKTTAKEYLDGDLFNALRHAENDDKIYHKMFVSEINCPNQNAHLEMFAVQQRFRFCGTIVGFHGIQSFREDEVTSEQAFEIGKGTA